MNNGPELKKPEADVRRQIIDAGGYLAYRGLIAAGAGNISVRVSAERVLITPAGKRKGNLTADGLIAVDLLGRCLDPAVGRPSSELGMHLCVYNQRPDISACVHAHPPYAVACSVAGISLAAPVLPEIVAAVGEIATAEYATPSTTEVAASISPLLGRGDAIILKNHGVLTIGPDLESALNKMEMVEHLAQVVFLASQLGRVDHLTAAQVEKMQRIADHGDNSLNSEAKNRPPGGRRNK
jgi:L-fuculose-phosphate aldolase